MKHLRRLLALSIACAWLAGCGGRASGPVTPVAPPLGQPRVPQTGAAAELPEPPVVKAVNGVANVSLVVNENKATGQPEFEYDHMCQRRPDD